MSQNRREFWWIESRHGDADHYQSEHEALNIFNSIPKPHYNILIHWREVLPSDITLEAKLEIAKRALEFYAKELDIYESFCAQEALDKIKDKT